MKKQTLALVMAGLMALTTACSGGGGKAEPTAEAQDQAAEPAKEAAGETTAPADVEITEQIGRAHV